MSKIKLDSIALTGTLIIVTVAGIILQLLNIQKTFVITPQKNFTYTVVDDRSENGSSIGFVKVEDNKLILVCEIIPSHVQWPYCTLSINLTNNQQGIDLSNYSEFKLWLRSSSKGTGVRFQARNFNGDYSRSDDDLSLKYNSVEIYEIGKNLPIVVPLKNFQVPTWWMTLYKFPPEQGGPEFDNVHSLDIATGYTIPPGRHEIFIERIEVSGRYMTNQTMYVFLLFSWMMLGVFHVIFKINKDNL